MAGTGPATRTRGGPGESQNIQDPVVDLSVVVGMKLRLVESKDVNGIKTLVVAPANDVELLKPCARGRSETDAPFLSEDSCRAACYPPRR